MESWTSYHIHKQYLINYICMQKLHGILVLLSWVKHMEVSCYEFYFFGMHMQKLKNGSRTIIIYIVMWE
jgi:hypothetical protein